MTTTRITPLFLAQQRRKEDRSQKRIRAVGFILVAVCFVLVIDAA